MKDIIQQFTRREAHVSIQFIKYGIGGVIATGTHLVVFFACSLWLFPALLPDKNPDAYLVQFFNVDVPAMEESVRQLYFKINNGIAFLFSNLVAYLINFHWVFHPGRHRRSVEVTLFFIVSIVSLVVGVQFGVILMRYLEMTTTLSQFGNIIAAVMINFICRKFIVFQR